MAEPAPRRRRVRRRRWWRRNALPRSRGALALGALVAVTLLILLLLGLTRARPGRDVPPYDPNTTTTGRPSVSRPLPAITQRATIATAPTTVPPPNRAATTTTRRRP